MTEKTSNEQYSDAEIQKRLDRALLRSLKMPPPGKPKAKPRREVRKAKKSA